MAQLEHREEAAAAPSDELAGGSVSVRLIDETEAEGSTDTHLGPSIRLPGAPGQQAPFRFPFAGQPDIVRSTQKDLFYEQRLQLDVADIVQQVKGTRFYTAHQTAVDAWCSLVYYGLTTLAGAQTLGEEYCGIMQVDSWKQYPSFGRRLLMVLLQAGGGLGVARAIKLLRGWVQQRRRLRSLKGRQDAGAGWAERVAERISAVGISNKLLSKLAMAHLVVFYFSGAYYTIAKRLTGIRYVFMRKLRQGEDESGYEVLGALLATQLAVQAAMEIRRWKSDGSVDGKDSRDSDSDDDDNDDDDDSDDDADESHSGAGNRSSGAQEGFDIKLVGEQGVGYLWNNSVRSEDNDTQLGDVSESYHRLQRQLHSIGSTLRDLELAKQELLAEEQLEEQMRDQRLAQKASSKAGESEESFEIELRLTIQRSFENDHEINNVAFELNNVRFTFNGKQKDVRRVITQEILRTIDVDNLQESARARISRWGDLIKRTIETNVEQIDVLDTTERYCALEPSLDSQARGRMFALVVKYLYEMEVIEDVAIVYWHNKAQEKKESEVSMELVHKIDAFVEWLEEEDDSDEDDDEDDSEEDDDDESEEESD
ncbi:peroxisome biogenesis factor 10 [Coemansia sp. Benny D115]|nr:peroxisome biogenesis factor 10 [Coemansia sp. Benny D115]